MQLIGREREIEELTKLNESNQAEFVALFGRRRVGKTYLVRMPKILLKEMLQMKAGILRQQGVKTEYLNQALENSRQDIAAGRVYTQEQAHQMMDYFLKGKIQSVA